MTDREAIRSRLARLSPEQAARFEARIRGDSALCRRVQPRPSGCRVPLTYGQAGLWFFHRLNPQSAEYNEALAFAIRGKLDCSAFERSIDDLVQRHAILRTVFRDECGIPAQEICENLRPDLLIVDLCDTGLSAPKARDAPPGEDRAYHPNVSTKAEDEGEGQSVLPLLEAVAAVPFDLHKGPLLRLALFRLKPDHHLLILVMSHIVTDGWSLAILARELSALYSEYARHNTPVLLPLALEYADFAWWQRNACGELDAKLKYWTEHLSEVVGEPLFLTDFSRDCGLQRRAAVESVRMDSELTSRLMEFCRQRDLTPFMVVLAAFKLVLRAYAGRDHILVGTPVANRGIVEVQPIVGLFVNSVPAYTKMVGKRPVGEFLGEVRSNCLAALENSEVPFERMVQELKPVRRDPLAPLFQVWLCLEDAPRVELDLFGLETRSVEVLPLNTKYDIGLRLEIHGRGAFGSIEYNAGLYRPSTMRWIARALPVVLDEMQQQPEKTLDQLCAHLVSLRAEGADFAARGLSESRRRRLSNLRQRV